MNSPEVLIIGAGLAGTSLAWHLAKDRDVLVLEQGTQHCAEASSQNAGMVRRLAHSAAERTLACRSAQQLQNLPSDDWEGAEPARRQGAVIAISDSSAAVSFVDAVTDLQTQGVEVNELDIDERDRIAPALRHSPIACAWHLPDELVCDAWSLGSGFVRGARRQAACFEFGVKVTDLIIEGKRIRGVRTDRGVIHADQVVLCTAAWTARLIDTDRRPLFPIARHLFFSAPHPLASDAHPWCWIDDVGVYVRPETGGFLCSPCDENIVTAPEGADSRRQPDAYYRAMAQEKLIKHIPELRDLRLSQGWIGLRTFTPDRLPLVGLDPEIEGLAWLSGLGGFGVTCGFALGELCAALLRGETVDWIDASCFDPGRSYETSLQD